MKGRPPKLRGAALLAAVALYGDGMPAHAIGETFDLSAAAVLRSLRGAGVEIVTRAARQRGKPWSASRRSKTVTRPKRRTKAEWMAGNIGRKGITSHGYVRVYLGNGRREYEHVLIAEKALGRPLKENERVHHVNCARAENRNDNLLICTHDYHLALHARMRAHPYWSQFDLGRRTPLSAAH